MTKSSIDNISEIIQYKDEILHNLKKIEDILKIEYPEQYSLAYQHWIPQIITAINDDARWLNRGQYSIQYTINSIIDSIADNNAQKGVIKFVK